MKYLIIILLFTSCVSYEIRLTKKDYKSSDDSFHRVKSEKIVEMARKTRYKHNKNYDKVEKRNKRVKAYNLKQIKKQEYNKRIFEFH